MLCLIVLGAGLLFQLGVDWAQVIGMSGFVGSKVQLVRGFGNSSCSLFLALRVKVMQATIWLTHFNTHWNRFTQQMLINLISVLCKQIANWLELISRKQKKHSGMSDCTMQSLLYIIKLLVFAILSIHFNALIVADAASICLYRFYYPNQVLYHNNSLLELVAASLDHCGLYLFVFIQFSTRWWNCLIWLAWRFNNKNSMPGHRLRCW